MKHKKWFILTLVLLVGALVLAACGGDEPVAEEVEEVATEAADVAEEVVEEEEPTAVPEPTEEPMEEPTEEPMEGDLMSVSAESCDYGGKILAIEATDMQTVQFTLCSPDPAFEAKAAFTPFGIYSSEWLEAAATAAAEGDAEELLSNPVGTGPYMVDEWVRGDSVIYTRFDDYWGEPAIAETAVLRWATEGAARLLELQTGNVHYITNVSPDDYSTVEDDPNLQLLQDPNPNILYLAMDNNSFEPFGNLQVRQAVAMGIDRQRIVENFFPEGSEVASHFTPCSIPNGCQGEEWYEFDAQAARDLLAEAGYPDGFETTIYYRDVFRVYLPEPSVVATEIQTQLRENLGIEAEIQVMESGAFIEAESAGELDGFYLLGWGADYPHVTNFLDFHFSAENPQFGDPHPEIYEVLQEASAVADLEEAAPLYEQANNAIKELVPMVPIAHGGAANAALTSLGNAYVPPFGAVEFAELDPGDDTLVFMQNAEPISLYCADETDGESLRPCQQVVEPLLKYQLDSGETRPALATGCESNETGDVWTCSLREGVSFHDGTTLDANDVVLSWAAGIDASHPLHVGNTGTFDYYSYLWNNLMNSE